MTDIDSGRLDNLQALPTAESSGRTRRRCRTAIRLFFALVLPLILASNGFGAVPWLVPEEAGGDAAAQAIADEMGAHRERLDQVSEELQSTNDRLSRLESDQTDLSERLDAFGGSIEQTGAPAVDVSRETEQTIEALRTEIDELRARMGQLRPREGEQREIGLDPERRFVLMEAASLLGLAKARAELGDDVDAAREAYRQADALIRRADDPSLEPVRRLLTQELDALENLSVPDWLSLQGRLQRQARGVADWPIARTRPADAPEAGDGGEESEGWIEATRNALGGLVRVSPRAGPTLSEEQVETLREMARLRWLAAELAIARRDTAALDYHLQNLANLITEWFDSGAEGVQTARLLIEDVEAMEVSPMPDILGQALTALRQHLDSA